MTSIRAPAVAGQFYEGTPDGLRDQIESTFEHDVGPGEIPSVGDGHCEIYGLVSPHAGYPYSGPIAAHGFGALAESGRPESVILLGPNHGARGKDVAVTEADAWETPLGTVEIDDELRQAVLDASDLVVADEPTHAGEHSLEVQVPYLQYLYDEAPSIVPIVMTRQDEDVATRLASDLGAALASVDRTVPIVASTDMTHYEPQAEAEGQDRKAIERMEALDATGLLRTVSREHITMCGYGPTATAIACSTDDGAETGDLLQYATSGDTAGSPREVVGYASLAIR